MVLDAFDDSAAHVLRLSLSDFKGGNYDLNVVYLTAVWCEPVNALVWPVIEDKVAAIGAGTHLLRIRGGLGASNYGAVTDVDDGSFEELCRAWRITTLPCIMLLDDKLDVVASPTDSVDPSSPLSRLHALAQSMRATTDVNQWLSLPNDYLPLQRDAAKIVCLREEAGKIFDAGQFLDAAKLFQSVLIQCADCPKANFNLAIILHMVGEFYFAVAHMLRVVEVDDQDAVAHTVLRTVLYPQEPALVIQGYASIIERYPDHVRAAHSLATLRGEAKTAAPAYVRQVFDHLAETFEEKLVTHLEYRVPWQLVDALQQVGALPSSAETANGYAVADLGCGTGLCGRLLRPFVTHIAGMDLSPLMIEKTRETGDYDELATADIIPFLQSKGDATFDLVISADVWIYVGALDDIFPIVARKLKPGTWFAFSTELLPTADGFRLASSGRFQHSEEYILELARRHGFSIRVSEAISVRKESGEPIPGRIYVLRCASL